MGRIDHARRYRQCRGGGEQRHAGAAQGCRPGGQIGIAPRLGEFGYEKQNDAVEGVILLRTGEKTQDVLKGVEAKTKELNEQILPKDVKVVPFYDRTDLIDADHQTVRRQSAARHVAGGRDPDLLPLRFPRRTDRRRHHSAGAAVRFHLSRIQGASANLLSIGAIDFGILVDGAVVMVENIFRQIALREGTPLNVMRSDPRSGGGSGPAAGLCRGGDRGRASCRSMSCPGRPGRCSSRWPTPWCSRWSAR